jgi:hypothetical protein
VKKNSFNIPKGYAINKRNTDNRMARHKMHESLEKWFGLVYGV